MEFHRKNIVRVEHHFSRSNPCLIFKFYIAMKIKVLMINPNLALKISFERILNSFQNVHVNPVQSTESRPKEPRAFIYVIVILSFDFVNRTSSPSTLPPLERPKLSKSRGGLIELLQYFAE